MSRTGLVACTNGMRGTALASGGEEEVLSRSRSQLRWASALRGLSPMLMLDLSSSTTRVESSLVSKLLPPGLYTNLLLLLMPMPESLGLREWVLRLRLLLSLSLSTRVEPSSVSPSFPPGSYTRLPLLLPLKLLGPREWLQSLLMWVVSPVPSLRAGLSSML